MSQIKVAAVSYLNTKPLLLGIEHSDVRERITLLTDYPANLARALTNGDIDMALLPVAAMPGIPGARIVSDYGIAADGEVASVCLFSHVPLEEIKSLYLDYQSRSSVRLATLLLQEYWKLDVSLVPAPEDYIARLHAPAAGEPRAGVIIGDRALEQRQHFTYIYDLAQAWKDWTGLPFVFAAWVANKDLPHDFLLAFNNANADGLNYIDEAVAANPFPYYDLQTYYRENIHYHLDAEKRKGLESFLNLIATS